MVPNILHFEAWAAGEAGWFQLQSSAIQHKGGEVHLQYKSQNIALILLNILQIHIKNDNFLQYRMHMACIHKKNLMQTGSKLCEQAQILLEYLSQCSSSLYLNNIQEKLNCDRQARGIQCENLFHEHWFSAVIWLK